RVTELAAVQEQDTQDIYRVMEDTQGRQTEIFQRVKALVDDSQYHYETGRLVDQEAIVSREDWAHSIGLSEIRALQAMEQARAGAPKGAGSTHDANRTGDDSIHREWVSGGLNALPENWFERMETVFRISNCLAENQVKFSTCTLLAGALTWWNSHVRIVGTDAAYEATEMATRLMDKKIRTYAERQAANKRKFEDTSRNNQSRQ
nr:retrotransposon Gag domain-containing protein [Tanacetum cinerariifolium]